MRQHADYDQQPTNEGRLVVRLTSEQRMLIARAAALRGLSMTQFVVASAYEAASETVRDTELLRLPGEAREVFINAVLDPPPPNETARDASRRYRQEMGL